MRKKTRSTGRSRTKAKIIKYIERFTYVEKT